MRGFFAANPVQIPGITPDDLLYTIYQALDKRHYVEYDIRPDEVNAVFTVGRSLAEITRQPGAAAALLRQAARLRIPLRAGLQPVRRVLASATPLPWPSATV